MSKSFIQGLQGECLGVKVSRAYFEPEDRIHGKIGKVVLIGWKYFWRECSPGNVDQVFAKCDCVWTKKDVGREMRWQSLQNLNVREHNTTKPTSDPSRLLVGL